MARWPPLGGHRGNQGRCRRSRQSESPRADRPPTAGQAFPQGRYHGPARCKPNAATVPAPSRLVCSSTPSGSHGERFLDAAVFSRTSASHSRASISLSHAFRRRSTPRTQYLSSEPSGCDARQERRLLPKGTPLAGFLNRGNLPGQTRDRVGRGCPDNIPVGVDPLPWTIERFRI